MKSLDAKVNKLADAKARKATTAKGDKAAFRPSEKSKIDKEKWFCYDCGKRGVKSSISHDCPSPGEKKFEPKHAYTTLISDLNNANLCGGENSIDSNIYVNQIDEVNDVDDEEDLDFTEEDIKIAFCSSVNNQKIQSLFKLFIYRFFIKCYLHFKFISCI
jgi:hypothetical protein